MKTKTILLTLTTLFAAAESGDAQTAPNDKKVLVAYFSHSGNTRAVAERIAAATGADLFEIVPQKPYPAEYRAVVDQARREIAADYFTGKTLIPFMTHEGSRMGRSEADIRRLCPGATVRSGVPVRGSGAAQADREIRQLVEAAGR